MTDDCTIAVDPDTYRRAELLLATRGQQLRAEQASTVVQIMLAYRHKTCVSENLLAALDEIEETHKAAERLSQT